MNSATVNKLKEYAEKYQADISRVDELAQEIKSYYWSLSDEVNRYSQEITFSITPIIDEDPLSRHLLQAFIDHTPELQDQIKAFHFEKWDEPLLCYYVAKRFIEFLKEEYNKRDKTEEEYDKIHEEYILLDALVLSICGIGIESLYNKTYRNEDGFFKYISFLMD